MAVPRVGGRGGGKWPNGECGGGGVESGQTPGAGGIASFQVPSRGMASSRAVAVRHLCVLLSPQPSPTPVR